MKYPFESGELYFSPIAAIRTVLPLLSTPTIATFFIVLSETRYS